jgi:quercetin dioxygenase-like cupin family protein
MDTKFVIAPLALALSALLPGCSAGPGKGQAQAASGDLSPLIKRTQLQRAASSVAGRDIVQVRTEIPVGLHSGWHVHPGEEVGYVVAGKFDMAIKDRETLHLQTGQGFLIPPMVPHDAHDLGPETGIMLSTYFVERERPVLTLVSAP